MTAHETKSNYYLFEDNNYTDRERLVMASDFQRVQADEMLSVAEERFGLGAGGRVRALDVGCGEAIYLFHLVRQNRYPDFFAWGLDKDIEAIETVQVLARIEQYTHFFNFAQHDLTRPLSEVEGLFGADGTQRFDLAMANYILTHLRDHLGLLRQLYDALAPGGTLLLSDPPPLARCLHLSAPLFQCAVERDKSGAADGFGRCGCRSATRKSATTSGIYRCL